MSRSHASTPLTPVVAGIETEYGLLTAGPQLWEQTDAALALLDRCAYHPKVPWDLSDESPNMDARISDDYDRKRDVATRDAPMHLDDECRAGFMLGNGARLYIDHGHPEYCTPECIDAASLVASDKAGEMIVDECRRQLERVLPIGQSVHLFKNNSDHQGHSYGCHEGYGIDVETYRALFAPRSASLHAHLIPFLVSRQVLCGAGKVGSENVRPRVAYQISQRADFFETLLSLETMSRRPIVNTRDEPHANRTHMRRLHVITGDANMAEVSTYLKVGTMQLFLAMLQDPTLAGDLPVLTLADPLAAIVHISHDPTCRQTVQLDDGRRLTAVEMQLQFAQAADQALHRLALSPTQAEVLRTWLNVLQRLATNPLDLHQELDWVIKWCFLEDWRARKGLDWGASELLELDVRYHDIDRERSVFYRLQSSGRVRRVVDDALVTRAVREPLDHTRAAVRAAHLALLGDRVRSASWSVLNEMGETGEVKRVSLPSAGL
jgi:proteasome accessory factor A